MILPTLGSGLALALLAFPGTSGAPAPAQADTRAAVRSASALSTNGRWPAAAEEYRRILALDPADGASAEGLATALFQLGDWSAAAQAFARAAALSPPRRADALYNRACALAQAGEAAAALDSLRQALADGYLATRTLADDPDLDPLRSLPDFDSLCREVFGPEYGAPSAADPASAGPTPAEMATGLRRVVATILARHPHPFRNLTRAEWEARVAAAVERTAEMSEAEYLVELIRLASAVGDVHTSAHPGPGASVMQRALPLAFWKFPDGLRVRATTAEHAELLGARVLALGGAALDELWPRLVREFPYENEWMAAGELAFLLRFPDFQRGLGLEAASDSSSLRMRLASGEERVLTLAALARDFETESRETRDFGLPPGWVEAGAEPRPLWLELRRTNYWLTALPESRAVYVQLNVPRDQGTYPWATFLDELVATVRRERAERLVLDLRHNPGGWGYMGMDLGWRLRELPEVNRPGHLFVLISRITQSAGVAIACELERNAHAVFVGEPLAAHPNFFNGRRGNHPPLLLPGTGIRFRVSEVEEQNSDPLDPRRFLAPDIPAPLIFEDLRVGRDAALEAALDIDPEVAARLLDDSGGRPLEPYFRWQRPTQYWAFGPASEHPVP